LVSTGASTGRSTSVVMFGERYPAARE